MEARRARSRPNAPAAVVRAHRDDGCLQQAGHHSRGVGQPGALDGVGPMSDVTVVLDAIQSGDPEAPAQLLPLVYEELHRLTHEAPGQTLQPTALVHEAYLRLVGDGRGQHWDGRGHFFAAAAEAMCRGRPGPAAVLRRPVA